MRVQRSLIDGTEKLERDLIGPLSSFMQLAVLRVNSIYVKDLKVVTFDENIDS